MDTTNKTEKIAAPKGKHDDYCDSAVLGISRCFIYAARGLEF